jgi:hypothetical protein
MKVSIVQFDDRALAQLGPMQLLMERNRAYAERHGYSYKLLRRTDLDIPTYWLKPRLCEQALRSGSDIVAWLDSDATFHALDGRIEDLFIGTESMVGAGDNPAWSSIFNAGVFFARGACGAQIMRRWFELFDPTLWSKRDGRWTCDAEWAGAAYEQGAFVAHLAEELAASGDLRLADWKQLQSPIPLPQSFTLHFPRVYGLNMPVYVQAMTGVGYSEG